MFCIFTTVNLLLSHPVYRGILLYVLSLWKKISVLWDGRVHHGNQLWQRSVNKRLGARSWKAPWYAGYGNEVQQYLHHLRTCKGKKFSASTLVLLIQELWGWGLATCFHQPSWWFGRVLEFENYSEMFGLFLWTQATVALLMLTMEHLPQTSKGRLYFEVNLPRWIL